MKWYALGCMDGCDSLDAGQSSFDVDSSLMVCVLLIVVVLEMLFLMGVNSQITPSFSLFLLWW